MGQDVEVLVNKVFDAFDREETDQMIGGPSSSCSAY